MINISDICRNRSIPGPIKKYMEIMALSENSYISPHIILTVNTGGFC